MNLLRPRSTVERIASFSVLLLLLFLIRIPAMPLITFLQSETGSFFALLLRVVHFLLQALTFACPVISFGFSIALHREQMRFSMGVFVIYAAMELTFQLLYTVMTYISYDAELLGSQLLITILQWLIFVGATFLLLLLAIWLIAISEKKDPSGKFFSLRDQDTLAVFLFTLAFFAEKLTEKLIALFQNASALLGPTGGQLRTFFVDITVILLGAVLAFLAARAFLLPIERERKN